MVNQIRWPFVDPAAITITLASLATSVVGVGRQSTLIDNDTNWRGAAMIYLRLRTGTTPVIDTLFHIYLILSSDDATTPIRSDGAGATDAGLTIVSANKLGTIPMNSVTSDQDYVGIFDTFKIAPLGAQWGIAVVHDTGVNLNSTEGNHIKQYSYYDPEVQ